MRERSFDWIDNVTKTNRCKAKKWRAEMFRRFEAVLDDGAENMIRIHSTYRKHPQIVAFLEAMFLMFDNSAGDLIDNMDEQEMREIGPAIWTKLSAYQTVYLHIVEVETGFIESLLDRKDTDEHVAKITERLICMLGSLDTCLGLCPNGRWNLSQEAKAALYAIGCQLKAGSKRRKP